MPYQLFRDHFPQIAEPETRSITVLEGANRGLPAAEYHFLEMFCNEKGCDCRRVIFSVVSSITESIEAQVGWGWEDQEFYANWMKYGEKTLAAQMKGPDLNMGSPQTELAPAILKLTETVLLNDGDYIERVKRHYEMFRAKVDGRGKMRTTPKVKKKTRKPRPMKRRL